jgi:hypothetical protein
VCDRACGDVTGSQGFTIGGTFSTTFFTVPAGYKFVLTDFGTHGYESGVSWYIKDNGNPRWSVRNQGNGNSAWARENWTTGLVFGAGHAVAAQAGQIFTSSCRFSWSGYLVPEGPASVGNASEARLGFSLSPNPSAELVVLRFDLRQSAGITLTIHDVQGRRIKTIASGTLRPGHHAATWDGRDNAGGVVPSGTYFAQLASSASNSVKKLIRLR